MKFRFEPTIILQTLSAVLALLVTWQLDWLTDEQAGLIVALVAAVIGAINAWRVRPVAPAAFTTVVTVGVALMSTYGFHQPSERIGAVQALVVIVVTYLTRAQVTPVDVLNPTSPTQGTVS